MNDKTNNPQEKIETAIDSEELSEEELEKVAGGTSFLTVPIKGESISPRTHNKWIDVLSVDFKSHKPKF